MRPIDLLREIVDGEVSPDGVRALQAMALRWLFDPAAPRLGIHRLLGWGGPRMARTELRNELLIEADALLAAQMPHDASHWARCQRIAESTRAFEARRWPSWRKSDAPPEYAGAVDRLLFSARQLSGSDLPQTPEAFLSILPTD